MNKIFCTILGIGIIATGFSQGFINKSKEHVKKYMGKYSSINHLNSIVQETDSTVTILVRDSTVKHLDVTAFFDTHDRCNKEIRTSDCDRCRQKYIDVILTDQSLNFIKLNDSTYVDRRLILHILSDQPYTYIISRNDMSGKNYRALIAGKE
jgi:hypothetical protein